MPATTNKKLLDLASQHDLKPFEDAWTIRLAEDSSDVHGLLQAVDAIVSQGQYHRAANALNLLLNCYIEDSEKTEESMAVLNTLGKVSPRDKDIRSNFCKVMTQRFAGNPGLEKLIEHSNIVNDPEVIKAAQRLESYLSYQPGAYVDHPAGWGVGIVRAVDADSGTVTIDFDEMKGHELELDVATNITNHLGKDHYKAMRFDRMDELIDMAANDPVKLVKCVVNSRTRTTAVRDMRERLTDGIIPTKDWSKWWAKTRTKAKRDPNIKMGTGNNPTIVVTKVVQSFEETTLANIAGLKTMPQKVKFVRDLLGELDAHPETQPALIVAAGVLAKSAKDSKKELPGARLSLALILERIAKIDDAFIVPEELDLDHQLEDPFLVLDVLPTVPVSADRKEILNRVKVRFSEQWAEVLERALYLGENDICDYALKELIELDAFDRLNRAIDEFLAKFREYRGSFMWFVKAAAKKNVNKNLPHPGMASLLEKAILLHSHCTSRFLQTEDESYRKEFRNIEKVLAARNYDLARQTLADCSVDIATDFYNMVRSSRSLPDDIKNVMVATIIRTRPDVAKKRAAAAAKEEEARIIDDRYIFATKEGYLRFEAEYTELVNNEIPLNAAEINRAASFGDLSENAEWSAALEKQTQLTQKAEEMREALEKARVIDVDNVGDESVAVGCLVTVENLSNQQEETYTLLGPWDVNMEKNIISYMSPLGLGLLTKHIGDEAVVTLPSGTESYRIRKITVAPEILAERS